MKEKKELNDIGKLLSKMRIDRNMTRREYAEVLGVNTFTLTKLERGEPNISLPLSMAILEDLRHNAKEYYGTIYTYFTDLLNVLIIPEGISEEAVSEAFRMLFFYDSMKENYEKELAQKKEKTSGEVSKEVEITKGTY